MRAHLLIGIGVIGVLMTAVGQARTWTEKESGRTLEGDLLRAEEGNALIRRSNGAVVKVPVDRLSQADQEEIAAVEKTLAEDATAEAKNVYKWETDFELASARAKNEKKHMLLDFTGSDWCGWCIKLKKEVFDKKEFQEYAAKNLVLVELDFPRGKKQSAEEKKQNQGLAKEYGISGYPTIILLDENGKKVGQTGYREGGPKPYVAHLEEMMR